MRAGSVLDVLVILRNFPMEDTRLLQSVFRYQSLDAQRMIRIENEPNILKEHQCCLGRDR